MTFLKKMFRRPTIMLSRNGRIYRWVIKARGWEPDTFCETMQASVEGMAISVKEVCERQAPRKAVKVALWCYYIVFFVLLGLLTHIAFSVKDGWMVFVIVGIGVVCGLLLIILAITSYFVARWAGKNLCPIKVRFHRTP